MKDDETLATFKNVISAYQRGSVTKEQLEDASRYYEDVLVNVANNTFATKNKMTHLNVLMLNIINTIVLAFLGASNKSIIITIIFSNLILFFLSSLNVMMTSKRESLSKELFKRKTKTLNL